MTSATGCYGSPDPAIDGSGTFGFLTSEVAMHPDQSAPATQTPGRLERIGLKREFIVAGLLILLLAGHFYWLTTYVTPAFASPDADGYFAQARLLVTEGRVSFSPESPTQYIGVHWLRTDDGRFICRYPPGFSALLAAAWWVGGRNAAFYVNPILATLTLLAIYLLCRPWIGRALALVAAAVFAATPLANYHAVHCDAHTASTFFLVVGLALLFAWARRPGVWRGLASGLALGILPTIRHAEAIAVVGIVVFLADRFFALAGRRKTLWFILAGAAIPIGLQLAFNHHQFGAVWKTAYSLTNEQQLSWGFFARNWEPFLSALMSDGVGLFFALGVGGLAAMALHRETRGISGGLSLIILGISAVYASYYFSSGAHRGWLRFLLPTLPLYLLPAFWLVKRLRPEKLATATVVVLSAIHILTGIPDSIERLASEREVADRSNLALHWLDTHVPAGSVIVGDRQLLAQIHFTGKWKLADDNVVFGGDIGDGPAGRGPDGINRSGRPSPKQWGKTDDLRRKYGDLAPSERPLETLSDLRAWAQEGQAIYWVGPKRAVASFESATGGAAAFEEIGRIDIPEARLPDLRSIDRDPFGIPGGAPGGPPGADGRRRREMADPWILPAGRQLAVFRL